MRRTAPLVALALAATLAAAQEIRRWRTADGGVHFGDNPPPGSVLVESAEPWPAAPRADASRRVSSSAAPVAVPAARIGSETEARRDAAEACRRELEARVRDPGSLEIAELAVSESAPASFTVTGTAATSNAYGRVVRSRWTCRATVAGFDRWRITFSIEDVAATELAAGEATRAAAPAAAAPPVVSSAPLERSASDAPPWLDRPAEGSDLSAISPATPDLAPRLSPSGRAVEFSSAPEVHWGSDDRKTIAFCVENFSNDWRKVAIRIADEQHQIGFVGPRATECNEIDTSALASGDASDLVIDERVASADEVRDFASPR